MTKNELTIRERLRIEVNNLGREIRKEMKRCDDFLLKIQDTDKEMYRFVNVSIKARNSDSALKIKVLRENDKEDNFNLIINNIIELVPSLWWRPEIIIEQRKWQPYYVFNIKDMNKTYLRSELVKDDDNFKAEEKQMNCVS